MLSTLCYISFTDAEPIEMGRGQDLNLGSARGTGCARPSASGGPLRTQACSAWATCAPLASVEPGASGFQRVPLASGDTTAQPFPSSSAYVNLLLIEMTFSFYWTDNASGPILLPIY